MATSNLGTAVAPTYRKKAKDGIIRAYTAELVASVGDKQKIKIVAPLPENYQLQLSTNFDNPFNSPLSDLLGGRIGPTAGNVVSGVTGISSRNKWLSSAVWQGGNLFRLTVPFVIVAQRDAVTEVVKVMRDMLKLVAPSEMGAVLKAPGPNLNSVTSQEGATFTGEIIRIRLGEFFEMSPCVIEDVSCDFDTQMEVESKCPMSVTITVSALSYWTTTREDIDDYFKSKIEPDAAAGG